MAANAWEIQHKYFGIQVDERWSQTGELLREYYKNYKATPESVTTKSKTATQGHRVHWLCPALPATM